MSDPCDDLGRNGWQRWAGYRPCGHPITADPGCPGCIADLREGNTGAGRSTMMRDEASWGRRVDRAPDADHAPVPPGDESEPDRSDWRRGSELPRDLKIGDRVPLPSRKLDVRPAFVDKLNHPRGVFNRGRKQTI